MPIFTSSCPARSVMKFLYRRCVLSIITIAVFLVSCSSGSNTVQTGNVMGLNIPDSEKKVISVMKFEDRSIGTEMYRPWRMGIPDMVMESLGSIPYYKVISREYMTKQVLHEQEFQLLGATDPGSAVKLGKLLNARYIVVGSYQVFKNTLQINAKVMSVQTGEIILQSSCRGTLDAFYNLQNEIAIKITDSMKLAISPEAKKKLRKKYDTKVVKASLANYSGEVKVEEMAVLEKKGKKQEVKKVKEEAKKDFKKALQYDSDYEKARKNLSRLALGVPMTL
jgi:TolB-like protein